MQVAGCRLLRDASSVFLIIQSLPLSPVRRGNGHRPDSALWESHNLTLLFHHIYRSKSSHYLSHIKNTNP